MKKLRSEFGWLGVREARVRLERKKSLKKPKVVKGWGKKTNERPGLTGAELSYWLRPLAAYFPQTPAREILLRTA